MVSVAIGVDECTDFGPKAVDEESVDEYSSFDRGSRRQQFLRSVPAAGTEQLYAVKIDERQVGNEHWKPLGGVRKKHAVDPRGLVLDEPDPRLESLRLVLQIVLGGVVADIGDDPTATALHGDPKLRRDLSSISVFGMQRSPAPQAILPNGVLCECLRLILFGESEAKQRSAAGNRAL